MEYREKRDGLHVEIDEGIYRITPDEAAKMEADNRLWI
jgi:hypothetical protein